MKSVILSRFIRLNEKPFDNNKKLFQFLNIYNIYNNQFVNINALSGETYIQCFKLYICYDFDTGKKSPKGNNSHILKIHLQCIHNYEKKAIYNSQIDGQK